jgi:tRNA(Ile)-lysidine synthase
VGELRRFFHAQHITADEGLLLAISGGRDSMVLGEATARLCERSPRRWHVATVDHGLRAEAKEETAFVRAAAKRWGVSCDVIRLTPPAQMDHGLLAWAREARYAALERVREKRGSAWIATAHHAQDQAETLLVRLTRGGALRGMPARRGAMLRPLLALMPEDLAHFARKHAVAWREDASNADPQHLRARLRAQVMPALQAAAQTDSVAALAHAAETLREDDDFLNEAAGELWREAAGRGELSTATVSLAFLKRAPRPLVRRAMRAWLRAAGIVDVSSATLAELGAGHGARLPGGREVCREGKNLRLL